MKILQVSHSFYPCYQAGGVIKVVYELSRALVKRGHQVTVVTTNGCSPRIKVNVNNEVNVDGIHVWYFQNISNYLRIKFKFATPFYLPIYLKKNIRNFDIIHIHEHRTILAVITCYFARKYRIPYIVQAHGSVLPFFERQNLKRLFDFVWGNKILKDAKKCIAVSHVEREQYRKMGIPESQIDIIPNGVNPNEFKNLPEKGKFRNKYPISPDDKIILYLGRIHKRKGLDFLIDSIFLLSQIRNDIKLILAGPDDGYLDTVKKMIQEKNLSPVVIFSGFLPEKEKYDALTDADVLVYPGIFEIFGLVPFEAILCGTPVIVTDDCGCGEIIKEAGCGYLVKYGDVNNLTKTLQLALENPDENRSMVERGINYIQNNLAWESIVSKIELNYKICL
ncbi:MAG: glycosyltransferase [Methanolinea tarda]|jgi:glycosyltransferase involved in cell wall biosynthesis